MEFLDTILSMQNLGNAVVSKGRAILKKKKKQTRSNTLYKDFDYIVTSNKDSVELTFKFGGASDYWDFVDEGVKGSGGFKGRGKMRGQGSPFSFKGKNIAKGVVLKWIANKPLKLRNKKGQFIEKNQANLKSAAYFIGRAIAQRGLERTRFFRKPLEEELNKQSDEILNAFANDFEKNLQLTIGN